MTITNYKRLEVDRIYLVEDSEGETHRLQFRGYGYCSDWQEDEIVFWETEHGTLFVGQHVSFN